MTTVLSINDRSAIIIPQSVFLQLLPLSIFMWRVVVYPRPGLYQSPNNAPFPTIERNLLRSQFVVIPSVNLRTHYSSSTSFSLFLISYFFAPDPRDPISRIIDSARLLLLNLFFFLWPRRHGFLEMIVLTKPVTIKKQQSSRVEEIACCCSLKRRKKKGALN